MSESQRKLQQAHQQAATWATIAKLLTFKMAQLDNTVVITKADQEAYAKAWPKGELGLTVGEAGYELKLVTSQEAKIMEEKQRRAANAR